MSKRVDHAAEILNQKAAISREIWIRGEQGDYGETRIAIGWEDDFGDSWRGWRLLKYSFVAVKCSMDIYRSVLPFALTLVVSFVCLPKVTGEFAHYGWQC